MKRMLLFFLTCLIVIMSSATVFAEDQIGKTMDSKEIKESLEKMKATEFDASIIKAMEDSGNLFIKETVGRDVQPEVWATVAWFTDFVNKESIDSEHPDGKYLVYVSSMHDGKHSEGSSHDYGYGLDFCVCLKANKDIEVCSPTPVRADFAANYDPVMHAKMIEALRGCGCQEAIDHYTGISYHEDPPGYHDTQHAQDSGNPAGLWSNGHFHFDCRGFKGGIISMDWLKGIYEIGHELTDMIDQIISFLGKALKAIQKHMVPLFFIMAIIDLALTTMLAGFEVNPFTLIVKVLKYGFFLFLIQNWGQIANDFFISLPTSVAETMTDGGTGVMELTQPHLILQKALSLISPGLNYATKTPFLPSSMLAGLIMAIFAIITMFAIFIFTMYIAITYIEFYIAIALSVCLLPFGVFGFTKFATMGGINYVWKCTVKMMVLAMIVGLVGGILKGMDAAEIAKWLGATDKSVMLRFVGDMFGMESWKVTWRFMGFTTNICLLMWFGWSATSKIAKMLSGNIDW